MEGVTMASILESIGAFFSWIITQAGSVISLIMGNPVLLLFLVGFTVCGFVLGWVARLFRTN